MFIQIIAACLTFAVIFVMYYGWVWTPLTIIGIIIRLSFSPPRSLLDWIQQKTGIVFTFHSDGVNTVYLTIDDGPSEHTHYILSALRECNGQALFFVIGKEVIMHPGVVRQIIDEPQHHELGNHDADNRVTAFQSYDGIVMGLQLCEESLDSVRRLTLTKVDELTRTPEMAQWMRPGCGLVTPTLLKAATSLKYRVLLGDTYGHDCMFGWFRTFLEWFYAWRAIPGSVIILHDGTEARAKNTAAVIRTLAVRFKLRAPPLAK
jgi:peptidoglycan/xylan/chitin deacetylase (PgdA/CDA1 family)